MRNQRDNLNFVLEQAASVEQRVNDLVSKQREESRNDKRYQAKLVLEHTGLGNPYGIDSCIPSTTNIRNAAMKIR